MLKKCMHDLVTPVIITHIKYIGALNRIVVYFYNISVT
jgi:hypothetical protein